MAKKKGTTKKRPTRRRSASRGGLMGNLTQAAFLAAGSIVAVKISDMLRPTIPDPMMRNGAIALGGAFLMPMLGAQMAPVGLGMAAGGMLNLAAQAMPQLGISGPSSMGELSEFDMDQLENALLEASDMNGQDDRNAALAGNDFLDYQDGLNGDERNSVLAGDDPPEEEEQQY